MFTGRRTTAAAAAAAAAAGWTQKVRNNHGTLGYLIARLDILRHIWIFHGALGHLRHACSPAALQGACLTACQTRAASAAGLQATHMWQG